MCQKQCRDDNGFKVRRYGLVSRVRARTHRVTVAALQCHIMSESHMRQITLFLDNPTKQLDSYSSQFEAEFMKLLRRRYGTKRVGANQVYQEYISDKVHLHMNATKYVARARPSQRRS
jgi:DNA/RNA-binding protein KIN17